MSDTEMPTPLAIAMVKYLLDTVCSILPMNDAIYEAQSQSHHLASEQ